MSDFHNEFSILDVQREYLHNAIDAILSDKNIEQSRLHNVISIVELKTLIAALRHLEKTYRDYNVPLRLKPEYGMVR